MLELVSIHFRNSKKAEKTSIQKAFLQVLINLNINAYPKFVICKTSGKVSITKCFQPELQALS